METILLLVFSLICIGWAYWLTKKFGTRKIYVHLKTGNTYTLLYEGKMKDPATGYWYPSVTYRSRKDGHVYTRARASFQEAFKNIEEYDKMEQI